MESLIDRFNELISLSWIALRQNSAQIIDKETHSFFLQHNKPLPKTVLESPSPSSTQEPIALEPKLSQNALETQRLQQLLPRPISGSQLDIEKTKKDLPALSQNVLYTPTSKAKMQRWAAFLLINDSHKAFIQSVLTAIESRLQIQIHPHPCSELTLQLPLAVQESDHVLFCIDHNHESSLIQSLENISVFSRHQNISPTPLKTLGMVHESPLHAIVLQRLSHEDTSYKAKLWKALQLLAQTQYTRS